MVLGAAASSVFQPASSIQPLRADVALHLSFPEYGTFNALYADQLVSGTSTARAHAGLGANESYYDEQLFRVVSRNQTVV